MNRYRIRNEAHNKQFKINIYANISTVLRKKYCLIPLSIRGNNDDKCRKEVVESNYTCSIYQKNYT